MGGEGSYAELLASVAAPGFARFDDLGWMPRTAIPEPPFGSGSFFDESIQPMASWSRNLLLIFPSTISDLNFSDSQYYLSPDLVRARGLSEDEGDDSCDQSGDDVEETEGFRQFDGNGGDPPLDGEQYASACLNLAGEMSDAAAAQEPCSYSHPKSLYIKRKRTAKGEQLPSSRPPREVGAIESAMRASASKETALIFRPSTGLVFDSAEEALEFYNLYSWEVGFGIRLGKSNNNIDNHYRTMQQIECSKGGLDKRCKYQSQRCDCKASIKLLRTEDHGWYISQFNEEHNHMLSESCGEKRQWKSHRSIDAYTKEIIRYLRENNISLSKVHCILGSIFGGVADLPFTRRSLRTICSQIARDQMDDDVKKTLEVFRNMRNEDPNFAFSVDLDGLNRVKSLIWANSRSKMQYLCFGDVVTFDTTFCTNIYKMPFGLFVGVNNHFQSTIFAGVLMRDETEESFVWVYKEFLSLMGGKQPQTVLTDQCVSMGTALASAMPGTAHLWCKWHVLRKAQESLGPVYSKNFSFRNEFHKVLNEMLTIDEFETAWEILLGKYNLTDNPFMVRIYECRHMWAKPFSQGKFCARMLSTQRVESANHMLKTYVPRNSSMNRFVLQFNQLLYDRGMEEDREEHKTKQVIKLSKRMWPIQRHAAKIYTRASYKLFSDEVDKVTHYRVFEIEPDNVYETRHTNAERREAWSRVVFRIEVEESGNRYNCQCRLYEHFGILCCHALAVIIQRGVTKIPHSHILKRWTKDARDVLPPHLIMYQKDTPALQSKTFRNSLLHVSAMEAVKLGDNDLDSFKAIMRHLAAGQKECKAILKAKGEEVHQDQHPQYDSSDAEWHRDNNMGYMSEPEKAKTGQNLYGASGVSVTMTTTDISSIRAPVVARGVGRPKMNRFRSPIEPKRNRKQTTPKPGYLRQTKFCSLCRSSGHKVTTCPQNPEAGKKKRKPSKCSICGLAGHRSNKCHTKTAVLEEYEDSDENC